jgi:thioesterase domain-containing protein
MIPALLVQLEELPLTPNGKVDRRALPQPALNGRGREPDYLAPRNLLELQLTRIWQEVLAHARVGVRDNFFMLGGHSLLAVRLLANIHQQFGKKLPLSALFQGTTVEKMARLLHLEDEGTHCSSLVGIQPSGSKPPFFWVHPAGGNVFCYFDLAQHLGPDQPFFGLQAQGLNGGPRHTRIEEMAGDYIRELRSVQPEGPYLLGGWSLGGMIAFEMARQLEVADQRVAMLVLLDSVTAEATRAAGELTETDLLINVAQHIGLTFPFLSDSLEHLQEATADEQLCVIMEQAKAAYLLPPDLGLRDVQHLWNVFKTNIYAAREYRPQAFAGRLTLLRAEDGSFTAHEKNDPTGGWGSLASGGVEVQAVPGDHFTLLREPHVQIVAEWLRASINQLPEVRNIL